MVGVRTITLTRVASRAPVDGDFSFVDSTWLGRGGLFHSEKMHIVEKFTRKGDELFYDITIEDPDVFVEPWVMPTRILRPGGGDTGIIGERAHCEAYEQGDVITNQLRH